MTSTATTLELQKYDFYTLVDISGSMGKELKNGKSRLEAVRETAEQMARVADKIDSDGGSIGFFNNAVKLYHNTTAEKMENVFSNHAPSGSTATDQAVKEIWNHHKSNSSKKFLLTVFTDGEADNKQALEDVIVSIANSISDPQDARIQFIQVGNDPECAKFLEHLDSGLQGRAKHDIFNYETLEWVESNGAEKAFCENVLDS